MKIHLMAILTGFLLDLLLGDPYRLPHPVRAIGSLVGRLEPALRRLGEGHGSEGSVSGGAVNECDTKRELSAGRWLVFTVLLITGVVSGGIRIAAGMAGDGVFYVAEAILSYYLLAARSLCDESMKVHRSLKSGDVEGARQNVSMIVGRDTAALSDKEITKAAVETVAENTSDGVIAPLFYLAVGGPVLGWIYKAVNTMDSMVGYKNERYLYFGRAAARLDDLLNLIPARLSAFLMIVSAAILRMDFKNAIMIYRRDRRNHKSPNSAHTEAVCAGALRIQLAGDAWYFGALCKKQYIGDALREVEYEDIRRANRLMYMTTVLCLLLITTAAVLSDMIII